MLSCAHDLYVLCLKSILVAYLGVGAFCCLRLWLLVAGYAVLAHVQLLGCPKISWLLSKPY